MSPWPIVVVPAVVTALMVRLDAKLIGPYFALSEVIAGTGSVTAQYWYERATLRQALARRMLYPLVTGLVMSWVFKVPIAETGVIGLFAACLLLWPVLFHGLPLGVSRRDWEVPVLYLSFAVAYTGLAVAGSMLQDLITFVSDGDVKKWLADQFVANFAVWLCVLFTMGLYRAATKKLTKKVIQREGGERP